MKNSSKIQYVLSILTFVALVVFVVLNTPNSTLRYDLYKDYTGYIFSGFLWTIFISLVVFCLSFIFGGIMFLGSMSRIPYIRYLIKHLTTFMFGSPMLVVVIVFYFFIGTAFGISDKLFLGVLSLTLYFSIDEQQFLVCDIFGFTKFQMYYYIIFPQIIRIMLPPLSANLATVIKSSSLLYLMCLF